MTTSSPESPDPPGVLRRAVPALATFLAVRILGVLLLAAWSDNPRKSAHTLLSMRWDSLWYARIAQNGYGYTVGTASGELHSDLAFFPLLPLLERAGHAVSGVPVPDAGLVVSVGASMCAAVGIHAVAERAIGGVGSVSGRAASCGASRRTGDVARGTARRGAVSGRAVWSGVVRPRGGSCPRGASKMSVADRSPQWCSAPFLAVVLWALYPAGIVQWMAYSESLFTALAAWGLYAILTRRWLLAGTLAASAGLTRPVGVGVVLALWVGALLVLRQGAFRPEEDLGSGVSADSAASGGPGGNPNPAHSSGNQGSEENPVHLSANGGWAENPAHPRSSGGRGPGKSAAYAGTEPGRVSGHVVPGGVVPGRAEAGGARAAERVRMFCGVVLAPLGLGAYVLWVAHRTGRGLTGYLDVQAGWHNGFDGGWAFACFVIGKFSTPLGALAGVGLIVAVGIVGWGCVACLRARLPWPVLVYTGVLIALALGASGYFNSKPRFFVPIFPLWFPLAAWLSARRPHKVLPGLGAFMVVSGVIGALWLNGSGPP